MKPDDENDLEQISFIDLDRVAFDEMNIVELPFALLTRDTSKKREIPLGRGFNERLVADESVNGLPSALGERVVIGLMWFAQVRNGFESLDVRFALRDLVKNYVFPGRYDRTYTPNSEILKAVEEQIFRVAHTRIKSDRWYDKRLGRHVKMDASIIDYVEVIDPGGTHGPRVLEIGWGKMFWNSVRARYTKGIDLALYQRIEKPLDRRLFRWLDRQLAMKRSQTFNSCQEFGRYKLAMTGKTIERGGRTASTYIVKQLEASLKRLSDIGFSVELVVNKTQKDFKLIFTKKAEEGANTVEIDDVAADLVRLFRHLSHGRSLADTKARIDERDRAYAAQWISDYGVPQSQWMVKFAVDLQKKQNFEPIMCFRGLEFYEDRASAAFSKSTVTQEQVPLDFCENPPLKEKWVTYRDAVLKRNITPEIREELVAEARAVWASNPVYQGADKVTQDRILDSSLTSLSIERLNLMPEQEFLQFRNLEVLKRLLVERHGFDPWTAPVECHRF